MPVSVPRLIRLKPADLQTLHAEAQRQYPVEACALLSGRWFDGGAEVERVCLAENVARSPVMFRIAPTDLLDAYEEAERAGLELVGIFHSHPAAAWPSRVDLEYMRVNPVIWLIMSMPSGQQRAFHLRKHGIAPIDIHEM